MEGIERLQERAGTGGQVWRPRMGSEAALDTIGSSSGYESLGVGSAHVQVTWGPAAAVNSQLCPIRELPRAAQEVLATERKHGH